MIIRRTVGAKGQVVIPKDLREYLGIRVGSHVAFEVRDGEVVLRPEKDPKEAVREYISVVKEKLKKEVDIEGILEEEVLERIDLRRQ